MKRAVFILAVLAGAGWAKADSLAWWDVAGISAATTSALGCSWSDPLVRNDACVMSLSATAAQNPYTTTNTFGWSGQTDTAINLNKYISFKVKTYGSVDMTVSRIYLSLWRYGSGASNFASRSSLDGFADNLDSWTYGGANPCDRDSAIPPATATEVEFRLYMWNGGSGATYLRSSNAKSVYVYGVRGGTLDVNDLEAGAMDVTNYGAIPDDGLDDAPAFRDALNALSAAGEGTLYVPAGSYTFNSKVSLTTGSADITIKGLGQDVSQIHCNNPDGLFKFTFNNNGAQLGIFDLSCVADRPLAGTAIEVVNAASGSSGDPRTLTMDNVMLKVNDITTDSFNRGVVTDRMWRPRISSVLVGGPYGPNATIYGSYAPDVCFKFSNADQPVFRNCSAWDGKTGFDIGLNSASLDEPLIEACSSVTHNDAYRVRNAGAAPVSGVWIADSHPNAANTGITLTGIKDFTIERNLLYHSPDAELINPDYHDLIVANSGPGVIQNNQFHFGNARTFITINAVSNGVRLTNNVFNAASVASPVSIENAASVSVMRNNHYNFVHSDEQNAVALWHMDSAVAGSPDFVVDDDVLTTTRDNHMYLYGPTIGAGDTTDTLGNAIVFTQPADYAQAARNWGGARRVRIDMYALFNDSVGQQYIISSNYTFRIGSVAKALSFLWQNQNGAWQTLQVGNAVTAGQWLHIMAEVNPGIGLAFLEVEGVERDSMEMESDYLRNHSNPIVLGQGGNTEFIGKIDDTMISVPNNPPRWNSDPFRKADAMEEAPYANSIAGDTTDADVDDMLTFAKVVGPAWLSIGPDGALSGVPPNAPVGPNYTVRVTDSYGASADATLVIRVLKIPGLAVRNWLLY